MELGRDYLFCANDEKEMQAWINAIILEMCREFITIINVTDTEPPEDPNKALFETLPIQQGELAEAPISTLRRLQLERNRRPTFINPTNPPRQPTGKITDLSSKFGNEYHAGDKPAVDKRTQEQMKRDESAKKIKKKEAENQKREFELKEKEIRDMEAELKKERRSRN